MKLEEHPTVIQFRNRPSASPIGNPKVLEAEWLREQMM